MTDLSVDIASTYESISAVNKVMAIEQQPLAALVAQKSDADAATASISGLATKLSALSAAADALQDPSAFYEWTATSSDAAVVAAVSPDAVSPTAQSFSVSVEQIACEQLTYSEAQSTSTTPLSMSGVLAIQIGPSTRNVTIGAGDSLVDVAAKITASGARVSASVTFENGAYKLAVRGLDTGAANAISFSEAGEGPNEGTHSVLSLGLTRPANTTQTAKDALFTVDDVPMSNSTNQIANVIADVTLALTRTTTAATVTIASDNVLHQNLATFVDAYNDVVTSAHSAAGYGSQEAAVPELAGDSAVETSLDQISSLVATPIAGVPRAYSTLAKIGLERDGTGLLTLNADKLSAAIADDPSAVEDLFVTDPKTGAAGAMLDFHDAIDQLAGSSSSVLGDRLEGLRVKAAQLGASEDAIDGKLETYRSVLHDLLVTLAAQMEKANG